MATPASTAKDPELVRRSLLIRTVESNLKISFMDDTELKFRSSLLRCTAASFPNLSETQIIRLYEAACEVKFPSPEVTEFRKNIEKILGVNFNLKAFRAPKPAPAGAKA